MFWRKLVCFSQVFYLALALMILSVGDAISQGVQDTQGAETPEQIALNFIRGTGANRNFEQLVRLTAVSTQTYAMLALNHPVKFPVVFKQETLRSTAKYREEWDRNFAAAHLEFMTPEELSSILSHRKESPYYKGYTEKINLIGRSMQAKSTDILGKATAEALAATFERVN
jgi:hypothetical protein